MSVPGPVLGPCVAWIDADDVAQCCGVSTDDVGPNLFETVAVEACMALYEISGRQFTGLCTKTVRPTRDACSCWGPASMGLGPWYWTYSGWGPGYWGWTNECGDRLGCAPLSRIKLAGYPVREIVQVLIDGVELPEEDDDGNPNWRLDGWRYLTRMDGPATSGSPTVTRRRWPTCQNLALEATEPGTFEITYRCGVDPPELGRQAAAKLACLLYKSCGGDSCGLPAGTTKIVRQGVEIDRGLLVNWFDPTKSTGIVELDLFIRAYWQKRAGRRPAVFSPDVRAFPVRLTPGGDAPS